jgi:2-methylcitrate dehydratase PrpD
MPDTAATLAPLTHHVADFIASVRPGDVPADVLELGRKSILDGLGLALAGAAAESGHIVNAYLADLGFSKADSTVLGTQLRLPARFSAFANAIAVHAHDFDDTQLAVAANRVYGLLMHPTAPVLPAVLAVAERQASSGADFTAAFHVGIEVCCKLAEAIAPRHYQDGFHTTGTCGTFGAAAGVANLMRLDNAQCAAVLGMAGSQSAGLRENFGTMTKPFHPGRSAESGVLAADLVRRGFSATGKILEAPRGFFHAAAGGYDDGAIRGKLGAPWTFAMPGISIKPYPSGSLTHPAMSLVADLIAAHDIRPEQVAKIRVGTNRHMPTTLLHHNPTTELQAKFSMQFSMAILLLRRHAGLEDYTDETVNLPEVRAMMDRVDFHVDPIADAAGFDKMTSIVEIHLTGGEIIRGEADFGKGSPSNPMSWSEVAAKFEGCALYGGLSATRVRDVIAMVEDLPALHDIRRLTALLVV